MKAFKFSVVMPAYNVDKYLEEAVDSVVKQDIGFEENIQLILVNDGSSDNTDAICRKYEETYPDNVIYISKENGGVSSARNRGIEHAAGRYVNFFDCDDVWGPDAFSRVWDFFEKNHQEIDMVGCRQKYFEGKTGYTALDYKCDRGDRVVDIFQEPSFGQFSVTSGFFRTEAIKEHAFDERMRFAEDAKFITQILYKKKKYGVMRSVEHNFRKRKEGTSATQGKKVNEAAYLDTANYYYQYMLDYSREVFGEVIKYAQYAVINAIKYRVGTEIPDGLDSSIREKYIEKIIEIIRQIDDDVIIGTPNVTVDTRLYMLMLKYGEGEDFFSPISTENGKMYFESMEVGAAFGKRSLQLDSMNDGEISGVLRLPLGLNPDEVYCLCRGEKIEMKLGSPAPEKARISFNGDAMNRAFHVSAELQGKPKADKLKFFVRMGNHTEELNAKAAESSGMKQAFNKLKKIKKMVKK